MPEVKKKILIAEDDAMLGKMISEKFSASGFNATWAKDGEEALQVALKEHPDLILLDIIMPKLDGIGVLEKLREDAWGKDAEIILLTNLRGSEKVLEGVKYGVRDYLVKSDWKLDDIVKKAEEKLKIEKGN